MLGFWFTKWSLTPFMFSKIQILGLMIAASIYGLKCTFIFAFMVYAAIDCTDVCRKIIILSSLLTFILSIYSCMDVS